MQYFGWDCTSFDCTRSGAETATWLRPRATLKWCSRCHPHLLEGLHVSSAAPSCRVTRQFGCTCSVAETATRLRRMHLFFSAYLHPTCLAVYSRPTCGAWATPAAAVLVLRRSVLRAAGSYSVPCKVHCRSTTVAGVPPERVFTLRAAPGRLEGHDFRTRHSELWLSPLHTCGRCLSRCFTLLLPHSPAIAPLTVTPLHTRRLCLHPALTCCSHR